MDTTSPFGAAAEPRRGRPPLLAKAARNSSSIDRFLFPGASSSSSTSASSVAAMAGRGLGTCENQNPNVILCPSPNRTINLNPKCSPNSENAGPDKARNGRPLKNSSAPVTVGGKHAAIETQNPNVVPSPNSESNLSPKLIPNPNINLSSTLNPTPEDCPVSPKKASRGRPRKHPSSTSTEGDTPAPDTHVAPPSSDRVSEATADAAAKLSRKGVKRKRTIVRGPLDAESKASLAKEFSSELSSLFQFYREDGKIDLTMAGANNAGRRAEVAFLLEESGLPFSSLVANLLLQLKATDEGQGGSDLTLASLRSMVLSVGERTSYGTPNPDADVLEDDSDACLWCWEVRDIKMFPDSYRSKIAARRRKRRKIAERIAALSGIITVLTATYDRDQEQSMLEKAEEALSKTESEDLIRAHFSQWQFKQTAKGALYQEAKTREKEALKEQHRRARETEKERRRLDKEEEKEKKRMEKEEKKKIQLDKEKEERLEKERERLEKEASKQRTKEALRQEKEFKKLQDEVERDQKRKEKEEADLKKQSALKKQANIMDRFLQSKKDQEPVSCLPTDVRATTPSCNAISLYEKVMHDMDKEMAFCGDRSIQDLMSSHVMAWKKHSSLPSGRKLRWWGQRRVPKTAPINELRLQGASNVIGGADDSQAGLGASAGGGCKRSRTEFEESEVNAERCEADWDDSGVMDYSDLVKQNAAEDPQKASHFHTKRRKLLQFDKSHRPAYYGSFSKKSDVVRPRNPLKMDSNLDYENDSDEEWEEDDPGESLSDCEKDEDDERPDPDEDEEAGDGFVVPDGYLSESEVAHVDESDSESDVEHSQRSPSAKVAVGSIAQADGNQNLLKFARQCKILEQLTNQALQHNRPYIICNFHNRFSTLQKTDRICLEALKMCYLSNNIQIEVPQDPQLQEKVDDNKKPIKQPKRCLPEAAICEMVEILMSSTHGLKRLVDLLSTKFPTCSRSQLRAKIKEIADYEDNHWQVKKEVLEQLGITLPCAQVASTSDPLSKSPSIQVKPITKFFSKRCLPPETAGLDETSPIKVKESFCAKSNAAPDINILRSEGNAMPLEEGNPIQSM